jgi:hypothetical protein
MRNVGTGTMAFKNGIAGICMIPELATNAKRLHIDESRVMMHEIRSTFYCAICTRSIAIAG